MRNPGGSPVDGEVWFPVHDEVPHGMRFRYEGEFLRFHCSVRLPGWVLAKADPNQRDQWDLDDFSPAAGKRLLVPMRFRLSHRWIHGSTISRVLFLVARGQLASS